MVVGRSAGDRRNGGGPAAEIRAVAAVTPRR